MPFSEPYNKPFVLNEPKRFMLNGLRGIEPIQETMDFSPLEDVMFFEPPYPNLPIPWIENRCPANVCHPPTAAK